MHQKQNLKTHELKLIKLKGEIEKPTIVTGDVNITFSVSDRTEKLQGYRTSGQHHVIGRIELTDKIPHPTTAEHILRTPMEHSPRYIISWAIKQNSANVKELTQSVFSDCDGIRLGINNKMKTGKSLKAWILNNTLLNNP